MKMSNFTTTVTEFLLLGFSDTQELQISYALLFSLLYSAGLMGNLLIVIITIVDRRFHTPMYFFIRNLSIVDACYLSVIVPPASIYSLVNHRVISVSGCAAQIFLSVFLGYFEFTLLTVMARDRYAAICHPLHYTVIMSPSVCMKMTLTCLVTGLFFSGFHTGYTFQLSIVFLPIQLFCDIPSLLKITCSETFSNKMWILTSILIIGLGCFAFIIVSYVRIFCTVLRFPVKEDQRKAFSTCIPHIIVVSLFVLSGCFIYLQPSSDSGSTKNIILSILYSIMPPFLNPILYSLRNKQIKEALKIVMKRNLLLSSKV